MLGERSLQDSFELRGEFWLPADPARKIKGLLHYDAGRIEIEVFDFFSPSELGAPFGSDQVDQAEVMLGLTDAGQCTLLGLFRLQSRSTAFVRTSDEIARSTWLANRLFIGTHFEQADEIVFSAVGFRFDALEAWLGRMPFTEGYETSEEGESVAVLRHRPPSSAVIRLPIEAANLTLDVGLGRSGDLFRSVTWTFEASFTFAADDPRHYDWFETNMSHLRALLGLFVGAPVTPERATGLPKDPVRDPMVEMFFGPVGEPVERGHHPAQMVLARDQLGDRLESVIARWFKKREVLSTPVALVFGTLYTTLPPEFEFLALTQALETFHRRTREGLYVSNEAYSRVEEALVSAIPTGIPQGLRDALKSRIGYGNELSQRRRFEDLMQPLGDESARAVARDGAAFVRSVVKQRNYLTHYPKGEHPKMSPGEMRQASAQLRVFLFLLLFAEIGLSGTEVVEGLRHARLHAGSDA